MKTNKTNQLHFIFLLAVLGSTLEFWWPIIALYVAKIKIKCTVRCSVRYSARKWKALPFFLQDLQFPSAWDFLWGTANPAAKEACCFHWFFVSQKLVFSDTRVRRILLLCLLDEENTLSAKLVQVCKVCISLSPSLLSIFTKSTQILHYCNCASRLVFSFQGKKYVQAWWLYWKKKTTNAFLLPLPDEFVLCGCHGCRAAGAQSSIPASMARNWWLLLLCLLKERSVMGQQRCCRLSESSSLSITCKSIN